MQGRLSSSGGRRRAQSGFTMLEMVIALTLTAMVMVMVYSALNMALGIWGRERHRPPDDIHYFMTLLREQIGSRLPARVTIDDKNIPLLSGDESEFIFATAKSVGTLHGGAPVMVRYVFDAEKHLLYYSETPLMPGQEEYTEDFLKSVPYLPSPDSEAVEDETAPEAEWFAAGVHEFAFSYQLDKMDDKTSGIKVEWGEDPERLHLVAAVFKEAEDGEEHRYVFFPTFMNFKTAGGQ